MSHFGPDLCTSQAEVRNALFNQLLGRTNAEYHKGDTLSIGKASGLGLFCTTPSPRKRRTE